MALGQAPWGLWFVALPALVLLFRLLQGRGAGQAAFLGWFAGAGYFGAGMFWIVEPFLVDAPRHGWMAPFALLFLSFGLALFWAAAAWGGTRIGGRFGALGLALAFAASDLARGYVLTGFPWALIGHIWIDTPVAQAAALVGPVGLTLAAALLAALAMARAGGMVAAVLLLGVIWGGGAWRLAQPDPAPQPMTVRIIQPNAAQHLKWDPEMSALFFRRQLDMSSAEPAPDLIVWPETAVNFLLEEQVGLDLIAGAARGVPVALGIQRLEGRRFYNSLAVIDPEARVQALYDKHHLVPFGEYFPLGDLAARFGLHGFASQQGQGYSSGPGPAVLDLGPLGRVLPLICYEAVFPQDLNGAPERADWILQATNDAWFGQMVGPYQHLAQARLRAIEQGLPLIRAANTGVSAVIDARGRVRDSLLLDTHGYMDARMPGALAQPFYARTGDLPLAVLIGAGLVILLLTGRRKAS
ncbi:apolipoprotein N-acyltransferase [Halodurantibacterium flavum]|uniref:Apolipoprotein N-acyltransferase n=1 Tax=Halodurantibacterium flavum TaxID=1382802 RepID=A0ABW4S5T9_9RHOB